MAPALHSAAAIHGIHLTILAARLSGAWWGAFGEQLIHGFLLSLSPVLISRMLRSGVGHQALGINELKIVKLFYKS